MVYALRFFLSLSSKCSLFHNSNEFGSRFIHILYTGRAKIKKNNSGAKRLNRRYYTADMYMGADKSLARPGRKQANVSVRMA